MGKSRRGMFVCGGTTCSDEEAPIGRTQRGKRGKGGERVL